MTDQDKNYLIYKLLTDDSIPDAPDFTDEEWAGLCEEAPMTFELFISCIEKCIEGNYCECYFEILEQFPEYESLFDKYMKEQYGIEKMTPEEVELKWLEFKAKYIDGES